MLFKLTKKEFTFLRIFCEMPYIIGMDDLEDVADIEYTRDMTDKLEGRKHLLKDDAGKYYLNESLTFCLSVMKKARDVFVMKGDRSVYAYFVSDAIVMVTEDDKGVGIIWLPFLPVLIGGIANELEPFINQKTAELTDIPPEQYGRILNEYEEKGFHKKKELFFYQDGNKVFEKPFVILSDGEKQVLLYEEKNVIKSCEPDKADLINHITMNIAPLHGNAIRKEKNK